MSYQNHFQVIGNASLLYVVFNTTRLLMFSLHFRRFNFGINRHFQLSLPTQVTMKYPFWRVVHCICHWLLRQISQEYLPDARGASTGSNVSKLRANIRLFPSTRKLSCYATTPDRPVVPFLAALLHLLSSAPAVLLGRCI